jgi:hypothetical protein
MFFLKTNPTSHKMSADQTLNIPKFQWDRLQAALRRSARDFITDCATYIGVPPKELITKVQREITKDPVSIAFFETDEAECMAFRLQGPDDRFAIRCRKPTLLNTSYCQCHQYPNTRVLIHEHTSAIKMTRLLPPIDTCDVPEMWLEDITGRVYNGDHKCIGFYDKESDALTLFVVDEIDIDSRDGLSDISCEYTE